MKEIVPGNPKKNAYLWRQIEAQTEDLIQKAEKLAAQMKELLKEGEKDKERQLRNIQEVAEQSTSWAEVELFIRYQGARKQIPAAWVPQAIDALSKLEGIAKRIASGEPPEVIRRIHLELIRRVLGYTVRWHVAHVKGEPQQQGGR
ncbi:MAG TPA: hypothetical protein VNK89_08130 [Thermoflexus sp.]|nr:hypothetical protein [Thermoflexus sp.]